MFYCERCFNNCFEAQGSYGFNQQGFCKVCGALGACLEVTDALRKPFKVKTLSMEEHLTMAYSRGRDIATISHKLDAVADALTDISVLDYDHIVALHDPKKYLKGIIDKSRKVLEDEGLVTTDGPG